MIRTMLHTHNITIYIVYHMQILAILLWWDAISFMMLSRIHIKWEGPKNNKKLYKYMDGNFFWKMLKTKSISCRFFFRWIFSIFSNAIEYPSKGPTKNLLLSIEYIQKSLIQIEAVDRTETIFGIWFSLQYFQEKTKLVLQSSLEEILFTKEFPC